MTELAATFAQYPSWAGDRSVDLVHKRSPEFLPSKGLVREVLEDQVRVFRDMAESQRRYEETQRQLDGPREPRMSHDEIVERYGARYGIQNPDNVRREAQWLSPDDLRAMVGDEAYDAIQTKKQHAESVWAKAAAAMLSQGN